MNLLKRLTAAITAAGIMLTASSVPLPANAADTKTDTVPVTEDYARLLQYSLYFFDANRCGNEVSAHSWITWRGDCHTDDAVPGGFHDAGDHVVWGIPLGFSAGMLGWTYLTYRSDFSYTGTDDHFRCIFRDYVDYMRRSTVLNADGVVTKLLVDKGDGSKDHAYWGAPENQTGEREMVWSSDGASNVAASYAAALAMDYLINKDAESLKYAKALYAFSQKYDVTYSTKSFYEDRSCEDNQAWAALWLYKATEDSAYYDDLHAFQIKAIDWPNDFSSLQLGICAAAAYSVKNLLPDEDVASYKKILSEYLTDLYGKYSEKDFLFLDKWNTNALNCDIQFMMLLSAQADKTEGYAEFAQKQMRYILGNNPAETCFVCGFAENSPKNPYHRAASGNDSSWDNYATGKFPETGHVLTGGMVNGVSDADGTYKDACNDYIHNECSLMRQAQLVAAAAALYHQFKTGAAAKQIASDVKMHYAEGTCGENLTWSLDSNGRLVISGEGEMTNYTPEKPAPWAAYSDEIKRLSFAVSYSSDPAKGAESIGSYAFSGLPNLETAYIPDTLKDIGKDAFSGDAKLYHIAVPESVTSIGQEAFSGCKSLTAMLLPPTVGYIGQEAFSGCTALTNAAVTNAACVIAENAFPEGIVLHGAAESSAEKYAGEYSFAFENYLRGDADCDGTVTDTDAQVIMAEYGALSSGKESTLTAAGRFNADVDYDGYVDATDASWVLRYAEQNKCCVFDEETGTLTLRGNVVKAEVQLYSENENVKKVVCEEGTVFPADSNNLFYKFRAESIDLSNADTSGVTDMSLMFYACAALTSLDVSGFDTSSVTDMSSMFYACAALTSLDVSGFDTSSVTDMSRMFFDCAALTSLDLSGFDTANVKYMYSMFSNCAALTSLDLSGFDTSNVTRMDDMVCGCAALTSLNLSGFDTAHVKYMFRMFSGCAALTSLDLSGFDTSNVTEMDYMFNGCKKLTALDVSSFDTSAVTSMFRMFDDCHALTELDLSSFDTSNVIDMSYMFCNCALLKTVYVSDKWSTENLTDSTKKMFTDCKALAGGNGTAYDETKTDAEYARIDKNGAPGYFTDIAAKEAPVTTTVTTVTTTTQTTTVTTTTAKPTTQTTVTTTTTAKPTTQTTTVTTSTTTVKPTTQTTTVTTTTTTAKPTTQTTTVTTTTTTAKPTTQTTTVTTTTTAQPTGITTTVTTTTTGEPVTETTPASDPDSGKCGEGLTWQYDAETCTLTVSGKGQMPDYSDAALPPWSAYIAEIRSITVKDGVTRIGDAAFSGSGSLTAVSLPESVTAIGSAAFSNCSALKDIVLPKKLTAIADDTFSGCKSLASVRIPERVTGIGRRAFYGCTALTSVLIPEAVESIGNFAFGSCTGLKDLLILNPQCRIDNNKFTVAASAVIRGYTDSTAQRYAETYGRKFVPIDLTGDCTMDGQITVQDAQIAMRYYAAYLTKQAYHLYDDPALEALAETLLDVDGSGDITVEDAQYILMYYLEGLAGYSQDWDSIIGAK